MHLYLATCIHTTKYVYFIVKLTISVCRVCLFVYVVFVLYCFCLFIACECKVLFFNEMVPLINRLNRGAMNSYDFKSLDSYYSCCQSCFHGNICVVVGSPSLIPRLFANMVESLTHYHMGIT